MVKFLRIVLVFACLAAATRLWASDQAEEMFKAGEKAERAGDHLHAYLLYARAAALDPKNITYAARRTALQAETALSTHAELGPDTATGESAATANAGDGGDVADAREALPPPRLRGSPDRKTFDLKGDARTIFEKVGDTYGIQMVFEADYQVPPPFTFRLTDVSFEETLRALETVTNSFLVPVNPRLALVVRDTPQKRIEKVPAMAVAIPIPERMSAQEAQELVTAVQQTLEIRRANVDATRHVVLVRDQAAKVEEAAELFATLSRVRPQVQVDVQLVSVDKSSALAYGIALPNQFALVNMSSFLGNVPFVPSAFNGVAKIFGGGASLFAIGANQASIFASIAKSKTTNLLDAQIVALDGQAATLKVGEKYPIITTGYFGSTAGTTGTVYAPPPTVTFADLGLVLKITPSIHAENEVTLDLDIAYTLIAGNSPISGIPIIGSQKFTGKVRLKMGEWGVVAGLIQLNSSDVKSGTAGLSDIPILGRLFSQNNISKDHSEVLIVLKPHLTALPPWEYVARPMWVGSETRPITIY
jgi:type II secretory pathway component GspD/PulD (secretin)